ncbi:MULTISPECIES: FmdE family protein [Clostridium]|uniref:FmdE, molybdenum formylmethanofuran dehydrogenase operon n=1 Tax=Clostridium ragsdalei P11 TaxID=1353534 RepID=A0A1A6AV36_9CLOT|nr:MULTISPECIES: FmdE family protein [Clostridium]OBR93917.1 FmdE, molybdenum formylmethanofuran dehydrogenase operon [Clostridium ragsdalei P11]QXE17791.1 formylmethanofuran dehydrogenase [Clostridium sp. 001]
MDNHFEEDVKKAREFHGHLCSGIILGVRIARAGLNYLGIEEPAKNKDFIVFVETDRCLTDAVQAVTGCSLGKRRLKWIDYGKMGASFIDMNTQKGIRIVVNAKKNPSPDEDALSFWEQFTDEQLFKFEPVKIDIKKEDLPGRPTKSVKCEICHEKVMDGRDVIKDGKVLCKACANGSYYKKI